MKGVRRGLLSDAALEPEVRQKVEALEVVGVPDVITSVDQLLPAIRPRQAP